MQGGAGCAVAVSRQWRQPETAIIAECVSALSS